MANQSEKRDELVQVVRSLPKEMIPKAYVLLHIFTEGTKREREEAMHLARHTKDPDFMKKINLLLAEHYVRMEKIEGFNISAWD